MAQAALVHPKSELHKWVKVPILFKKQVIEVPTVMLKSSVDYSEQ